MPGTDIERLARRVITCRRCPRLVTYREAVAAEKRRAFKDEDYWGKPLPGFGAPDARLFIVGLAPAAHGGNRTGRMFTGDRSGDWLYGTLHRHGFANQGDSVRSGDGMALHDTYITAAARCAPPDNKPTREELAACQPFLERELQLLPTVVVIALGQIAFSAYLSARRALALNVPTPAPKFAHLATFDLGDVHLIGSYHPSQRNTQTGFLTASMFDAVFLKARGFLDA